MSKLVRGLSLVATILSMSVDARSWKSDDTGLANFISRPDLRPQTLNITSYEPNAIAPGYWFTAPYYKLHKSDGRKEFRPGQVGPHIFDSEGELIWSGAIEQDHRNAFDFRVAPYNGLPHLTFITERQSQGKIRKGDEGIIMNSSYHVVKRIRANDGKDPINLHEVNVLPDNRALLIHVRRRNANVSTLNNGLDRIVKDNGFQEIDLDNGTTLFNWHCVDHVPVSDSYYSDPLGDYDYFHANAVDKTASGDYLLSGRYTSTIYKISGQNGSIVWKFGGKRSDFELVDFNFGFQHHVRLVGENETHTTISFLNNASDQQETVADHSSAMIVVLDTVRMKAELLQAYDRPDGRLTELRGSVQSLPGGNVVVGWSTHGYTSEFTRDGRLVQELIYSSNRMNDYRTYKYEWKGSPQEPPTLKSYAYGTSKTMLTVHYMSWNGATEVESWNIYVSDSPVDRKMARLIGRVSRTGFETMLVSEGYHKYVYAEAISAAGESLGLSPIEETTTPSGPWYDDASITSSNTDQSEMTSLGGRVKWFALVLVAILILLGAILLRHAWIRRRKRQGSNHEYMRLPPPLESVTADIDDMYTAPVAEKRIPWRE